MSCVARSLTSDLLFVHAGISWWQMGCLAVLFVGIFFTLEPSIFNMRPYVYPTLTHPVDINAGSWYFYVTFAMAWLPLAIGFVIMEKVQKAYVGVRFSLVRAKFSQFLSARSGSALVVVTMSLCVCGQFWFSCQGGQLNHHFWAQFSYPLPPQMAN